MTITPLVIVRWLLQLQCITPQALAVQVNHVIPHWHFKSIYMSLSVKFKKDYTKNTKHDSSPEINCFQLLQLVSARVLVLSYYDRWFAGLRRGMTWQQMFTLQVTGVKNPSHARKSLGSSWANQKLKKWPLRVSAGRAYPQSLRNWTWIIICWVKYNDKLSVYCRTIVYCIK